MQTLFSPQANSRPAWIARLLIVIVLFWNLQAAVQFMLNPAAFAPSFQLEGVAGRAAVAGFGILFLMWQVPYIFALLHPVRFHISLWSAVIMQTIGVIGESILLTTIPDEYVLLRGSIIRFIVFDGTGVLLLLGALWWVRHEQHHPPPPAR
jgi:glucan phosphoethanolaminetransferase (alkaline phosphatase superfamily)